MKFTEVLETIELVLECNDVPLIIGESGIGKTALAYKYSKDRNLKLVTIDANLLKEGEIGGLPMVKNRKTLYATHHKLSKIEELVLNGDNVLLFIDELNRCDHAVQQELMNLILNREINGYSLDKSVKIIAAMNPSNRYEGFSESEYLVVDMDPAQEDRFVWLNMESDIKEWIKWGMDKGNIHIDVIEFLSSFPEYLHTPNTEGLKATPRSWERISKAYGLYKENKCSLNALLNVVGGNVSEGIALDFGNFISNIKKKILTPNELFEYEVLPLDLREELKRESHSRLYILAKNSLNFLEEDLSDKNISLFSSLLKIYPRDLRLGIMKEIKRDYSSELFNKINDCDEFIEAFFDIFL